MLLPRKKPCLKHNTQKSILMYTMANTRKTALNTHLHVSRLITPRSEVRARSRAPESGGGFQLRGWRLYKKKKHFARNSNAVAQSNVVAWFPRLY